MAVLNRLYAYSRLENEDPEEAKHRRAQFLIYKAMQRAATRRRRPSWLRVRIFKLKIKIGKRFKGLTKGLSSAKADLYKQVACLLRSCKYFLHAKEGTIVRTLPTVS